MAVLVNLALGGLKANLADRLFLSLFQDLIDVVCCENATIVNILLLGASNGGFD
jgi:hypothetical protein